MAADSYNMEKSFVYANKEVLEDSIVILAVVGKISFDISVAQNMKPVGKQGKITSSIGTQVKTINNMPAMDFIKQEIGKPLDSVDEGVITFKLTDDKEVYLVDILNKKFITPDKTYTLDGTVVKHTYFRRFLELFELLGVGYGF